MCGMKAGGVHPIRYILLKSKITGEIAGQYRVLVNEDGMHVHSNADRK